jgi:probable rRNA maturation factor
MNDTQKVRVARLKLSLVVQYAAEDRGMPSRPQVRKWVSAASTCDTDVTVRFADEAEGRWLNVRYRGKRDATNVLSFSYSPPPTLRGDIVLCVPVVRREADLLPTALDAHFAHLIVHGILHLRGYDHETGCEAQIMETMESGILKRLGYPDPYARNR